MPELTHGGRLDLAARRFPHAPAPWVDLSTGINPMGWDACGIDVDWSRLPDPSALAGLEQAARAAFGMRTGAIATLPGTEIGLRLLRAIGLPAPARHAVPSYATHAVALADSEPATLDAIGGGTLLLANPNNPDGRIVGIDRLRTVIARQRESGGWLIIDEAFADSDPGVSIVPHLEANDPVLVFRSFGKFFGLAGLRLGFVCGPTVMVERVRKLLGSWPVSTAAIAIGTAAYRDSDWIARTRVRLADDAGRLDILLRAHGLEPYGDCPLFRLTAQISATAMFERLAEAGILTRTFEEAPGWLRFGLPGDERAWSRLEEALRHG